MKRDLLALNFMVSLLMFLALFTAPVHQAEAAKIISSQAGRVQQNLITTRQVLMSAVVEQALSVKAPPGSTQVNVSALDLNNPRSREFVRQTTAALLEWAIYYEAQAFSTAEVTPTQLKKARREVLSKIYASSALRQKWDQIQPTPSEIDALLDRKLRAKKFIQFKIESSALPVTDKEAQAYFESNRLQFEDLPFEKFKPKIKELIGRQQIDRRIKDWFELLHSKYKLQNELSE